MKMKTGPWTRIGLALVLIVLTLLPAGVPVAAEPQSATLQAGSTLAWQLPFMRFGHTAVKDLNDDILVFGGFNGRQYFNDVWKLDFGTSDSAWTKLQPKGLRPPPRAQHSAIWDIENRRMIVFGGHTFNYNYGDLWALEYEGTTGKFHWRQLTPAGTPPPARRWHTAVYEYPGARMIVFGGGGVWGLLNDVWILDLTPGAEAWSQQAVSGTIPQGRVQHAAALENYGVAMYVFGGAGSGGALLDDTWQLDITTWQWNQILRTGPQPPARRGHTMVFNPTGGHELMVYGGLGNNGFLGDFWESTGYGDPWIESTTEGGPPAARAWHTMVSGGHYDLWVIGGRGMDPMAGETQWSLDFSGSWPPDWVVQSPLLPAWGGASRQSGDEPAMTFTIEDAEPETKVNVMRQQEVWFVAKLTSPTSTFANDITVTMDVVNSRFEVTEVGTRYRDADPVQNWQAPIDLTGGQYQSPSIDLERRGSDTRYQAQVVFKAIVRDDAPAGRTSVTAEAAAANWGFSLDGTAYAQIYIDPQAWIVTNRTKLFEAYDKGEVRSLLDRAFEKAEGGSSGTKPAVVLYADRYVPALATWDNTTINYASEASANPTAAAFDAWLEAWNQDPTYLVILGDDNVIPFWRKHDYPIFCSDGSNCQEDHTIPPGQAQAICANWEPVCMTMVQNNYYMTDNPYGEPTGNTPAWQRGDVQVAVGRIVGATAADMERFLRNSTRGPRSGQPRAILASDGLDWGLPGRADAVSTVRDHLGYTLEAALTDPPVSAYPSEAMVVAEMNQGFGIMGAAHHGTVNSWTAPDGAGVLMSTEIPGADPHDRMRNNRPFYNFNSCRTGIGYSDDGAPGAYADSMVYALVEHYASGVLAHTGLMFGDSDPEEVSYGEILMADFWEHASAGSGRPSDPLGLALVWAKAQYNPTDDTGYKTTQTPTYYGVPWMRLPNVPTSQVQGGVMAFPETQPSWSPPVDVGGAYAIGTTVDSSSYTLSTTDEGFDLLHVDGLELTTGDERPALPRATLEVMLPLSATISDLVFTATQELIFHDLDIPTRLPGLPYPGGAMGGYTTTAEAVYPVTVTMHSHPVDGYQIVQVDVIPVTYDAATDDATLYRNVAVRLEYATPEPLVVTNLAFDQFQYLPGETISTTTHIINAGDVAETVTATLVIQDLQGEIVRWQGAGSFEVPAGGEHDLALNLIGPLDGGSYLARVLLWQGGVGVGGAGQEIRVTQAEVADPVLPAELHPGMAATFAVDLQNLGSSSTLAMSSLVIYDESGAVVDWLSPQIVTIPGASTATLSFTWTPAKTGMYQASFVIQAGGEELGPLSASFEVGNYQIYLPLVMRRQG
ncbi:MAG: hypothetical protein JXA93_09135 [Anaerolineae bacterium]|nr:hypothetical protein [Anaerolineae bacterium]